MGDIIQQWKDEKKEWLENEYGKSFIDGFSPEQIEHYYRGCHDYAMAICDADDWAWLNTLFRYDIGAERALAISNWFYENEDCTTIDAVNADQKEMLQNICKKIGLHFDFAHWPDEDPKCLEYGFKEWYEDRR